MELHAPQAPTPRVDDAGLPPRAGVGFKPTHLDGLLADPPAFVEVHAENYFGAGGLPHAQLRALCEQLPLSVHGVGLSIGGATSPDAGHLGRLATLLDRYQPASFSEHLAWATHDGRFFNDLLPLRYDNEALRRIAGHIDLVQARLGRRLLLENPSTYFLVPGSTWGEAAFLAELVRRTGCGLLLDVNNVHVSCHNNGGDPQAYVDALPLSAVGEIHLAGHFRDVAEDGEILLIDTHGAPVCAPVWDLYARVIARTGPLPTLIEWDTDVPEYAVLRDEARRADAMLADASAAAFMHRLHGQAVAA